MLSTGLELSVSGIYAKGFGMIGYLYAHSRCPIDNLLHSVDLAYDANRSLALLFPGTGGSNRFLLVVKMFVTVGASLSRFQCAIPGYWIPVLNVQTFG